MPPNCILKTGLNGKFIIAVYMSRNLTCRRVSGVGSAPVWVSLSVTRSTPGVPGKTAHHLWGTSTPVCLSARSNPGARCVSSILCTIQVFPSTLCLPSSAQLQISQSPPAYGSYVLVCKAQDVIFSPLIPYLFVNLLCTAPRSHGSWFPGQGLNLHFTIRAWSLCTALP